MNISEALIEIINTHRDLSGGCIRALVKVYEDPAVTYNKSSLAKALGLHRRGVDKIVATLIRKGLVDCPANTIKLTNIITEL